MAFKCISVEHDCFLENVIKTFILDSEEDVASLPFCGPGSMAIVANGGKVFMKNASGEWANFTAGE